MEYLREEVGLETGRRERIQPKSQRILPRKSIRRNIEPQVPHFRP